MPLLQNIEEFQNVSPVLQWAIFIVACLIAIVAVISVCISIWLSIRYVVYNRKTNSKNLTGKDAARQILDKNGLQHIKVSVVGSMMFGNSYSHYFKKSASAPPDHQKAEYHLACHGCGKIRARHSG